MSKPKQEPATELLQEAKAQEAERKKSADADKPEEEKGEGV